MFACFHKLVDECAFTLEKKGIKPGDRVAFLAKACPKTVALFFALWRIGASACPLNPRLTEAQIEMSLKLLQPQLFIDSFPIKNPLMPTCFPIPYPAALIFTSGSTTQKIAVLSLTSLLYNAKTATETLDLHSKDRWLLHLPLHHVSGIGIILRCYIAQAELVFDSRDHLITHLSVVPTQLYRATPVYKYLRCVLIGGAPIQNYPKHLPCFVSYGLTEMGSLVTAQHNPQCLDGTFFLGHPLPGRNVCLDEQGEILVKGPCLFQGYWQDGNIFLPLKKERSSLNETKWFATGDIGRITQEGLAVIGRKDWRFCCGGEKIQPEEIEHALLQLPNILEAAVIPIKDLEYGNLPIAICSTNNLTLDTQSIKFALTKTLLKHQIPHTILLVKKLPRNGLKIDRKKLFTLEAVAKLEHALKTPF